MVYCLTEAKINHAIKNNRRLQLPKNFWGCLFGSINLNWCGGASRLFFVCILFLFLLKNELNDKWQEEKQYKAYNKNENKQLCKQMPTMTSIGCCIQNHSNSTKYRFSSPFFFNHFRIQIKSTFYLAAISSGCMWDMRWFSMHANLNGFPNWSRQLKVFWFYANETRKFTANRLFNILHLCMYLDSQWYRTWLTTLSFRSFLS